ncbi:hypothetical protein EV194_103203 [Natronoflexus pectinivorans]|uniref:Uncharacterized protein n=1 Tax=Natronoflexus pectinivorans TaxID=682526 RepID=A0A4R2GKB6_9BACT|nr:hypothetical protein EV194_103203 [Natronoflexus pectinivorans]
MVAYKFKNIFRLNLLELLQTLPFHPNQLNTLNLIKQSYLALIAIE